jgi:hypothetical protein
VLHITTDGHAGMELYDDPRHSTTFMPLSSTTRNSPCSSTSPSSFTNAVLTAGSGKILSCITTLWIVVS